MIRIRNKSLPTQKKFVKAHNFPAKTRGKGVDIMIRMTKTEGGGENERKGAIGQATLEGPVIKDDDVNFSPQILCLRITL
mmetsp:Transcript_29824/g.71714  ORF Transcript_29824/g.71714 Transcript_29824/m.71714 type:complete len:80 (-) Transcript_29824:240-479(-)